MDERHLLNGLMKAVAEEKSEYVVRPFFPGMKKFAAFAYIAERFGYRYMGHAPGNAALNNPYFLFQRASDARERAAATMASRPGLPGKHALPGMRPGRGLTPDAAAQPEVDLLYSRMIIDACSRYNPRVLSNVLLFPVVAAIFLIFPGYTAERVVIAGGIWLALITLYLVGLSVTRYRRAKHLARLSAAGVEWPPRAAA
ncbi:hypothetical protein [Streptomyces sp. NPDC050164]|uniref:hypothetical protein n=1 Tax=Streptomyces sp. NPDC050164 TaxID=3365605 RepID=UPI0037AD6B9C